MFGLQVIFGIGLNQLADFYAERVPNDNPVMRSMAGSFLAGHAQFVVFASVWISIELLREPAYRLNFRYERSVGLSSGYLSHVPHNLSTLMLNNPSKVFVRFAAGYLNSVQPEISSSSKGTL